MLLIVPLGSSICTAARCTLISVSGAISRERYASLIFVILPTRPPAVITSSPFARASIICFVSLARFICGRIMKIYSTTNIRTIGRKLSIPESPAPAPPVACANAEPIKTCSREFDEGKAADYTLAVALGRCSTAFQQPLGGLGQPAGLDRRTQVAHEGEVVVQVVNRIEPSA